MSVAHLNRPDVMKTSGLAYEHRRIIELMEAISDKFERGESRGVLSRWFGELLVGVSAHFALEETLMRDCEYADYAAHKSEHERLLDDILCMMDACEEGRCTVCNVSLRQCLAAGFGEHVRSMDSRIAALPATPEFIGIPIEREC